MLTKNYEDAIAYLATIPADRDVTMNLQYGDQNKGQLSKFRCHIHLHLTPAEKKATDKEWHVINAYNTDPAQAVTNAIKGLKQYMKSNEDDDLFS